MHGAPHPKSDINIIYVPRKRGGRSFENCIRIEDNNMGWYVKHSTELSPEWVKAGRIAEIKEFIEPREYKRKKVKNTKEYGARKNAWIVFEGSWR